MRVKKDHNMTLLSLNSLTHSSLPYHNKINNRIKFSFTIQGGGGTPFYG